MKKKIILFVIIFSIAFNLLRISYHGELILAESLKDLGGVPWLYSAMGLMFSVLAAYILEKEWGRWDKLIQASKGELNNLRELWYWSFYLKNKTNQNKIRNLITGYLKTIGEEWDKAERGEHSSAVDLSLFGLRESAALAVNEGEKNGGILRSLFIKLSEQRELRLFYSALHIPISVRRVLTLAASIMISLSLLIGVKSIWLDYVFTLSIGILVYSIYIVIDDLNHPFKPGTWHLTPKSYERLLAELEKGSSDLNKLENKDSD